MKVAIMQPYLFPYIGYFQLINAVDTFVIYDEVNYIKQGWINRNKILLNSKEHLITLNLVNSSSFKLINEIEKGHNNNKLLKTIEQAYKKAPFFHEVYSVIEDILKVNESNLASFLEFSIRKLAIYLGIKTHIVVSSRLQKDFTKKGQDKVIDICKGLNASIYINAIGGQQLYSKEKFSQYQIDLKFIKTNTISYRQFNNEFVPWLSIIDVMMFNSKEEIIEMLYKFELL
jgi:hypothetical protein